MVAGDRIGYDDGAAGTEVAVDGRGIVGDGVTEIVLGIPDESGDAAEGCPPTLSLREEVIDVCQGVA